MERYIELVKTYPILTAMVQFAILGTFGDIVSKWIVERKISKPFTIKILFLKAIEWAFLAILIKYAFVGFKGFVKMLVTEQYLPELGNFGKAFAISTSMNLQFGLLLVIMHRLLDNLIARQSNWNNIDKGFYSLIWFWIPAHTVTFMLPKHFQIGLAALWSIMLGIILGFYKRKAQNNASESVN